MSEWMLGSYEGILSLGKQYADDYRGYVVLVSEAESLWYAYNFIRGEHVWLAEGSKEQAKQALETVSVRSVEDTLYTVATYSYACTAYVRTTLRRGLELQSTYNVWAGTEYINAATAMVPNTYVTCKLPDNTTWELTRTELMTIHRALEWRKGVRKAGSTGPDTYASLVREWSNIEEEVFRVLQGIWHSEGKYWM